MKINLNWRSNKKFLCLNFFKIFIFVFLVSLWNFYMFLIDSIPHWQIIEFTANNLKIAINFFDRYWWDMGN